MKKGIIVLLIMALVAGYAFAGFSGSAEIGYSFDLDSKDNGIYNANETEYKFTFELDKAAGESAGEGKVYAEIAGTASAVIKENAAVTVEAKITKANIVAGDVKINILGPKGAYNYASSYYKDTKGKKAQYDYANAYEVKTNGFVVSYKDFAVSFKYNNSAVAEVEPEYGWIDADKNPATPDIWGVTNTPAAAKPAKVDLFAGVQTPNFEVAEGLKVQAAANYRLVGDKSAFGGAAKAAYAADKLSASVAADVEYTAAEKLPVDVSATASYDFISASVYFGTSDSFKKNTNVLSAKVEASYDVTESVSVSAYGEVRDAIKDQKPWFLAGAEVDFAAEQFACYAAVDASIKDGKLAKASYGKTEYAGLGVSAGISSDALISNCTVALDWDGSDFSANKAVLGTITASAKVSF